MKLGFLEETIDSRWHELQMLSAQEAQFNFGVPDMLTSELSIIQMQIEAAKSSHDPETLERVLGDTQSLIKRLRSLLQQSQNGYRSC